MPIVKATLAQLSNGTYFRTVGRLYRRVYHRGPTVVAEDVRDGEFVELSSKQKVILVAKEAAG